MEVIQPETWAEALDARRPRPDAVALQGGTDVLVELSVDRIRPDAILDLSRTPLWAEEAERFLEGELEARGQWDAPAPLDDRTVDRFGELVAAAARPIDDVRATAAYRRRALAVPARRAVRWAWEPACA